MATMLVFNMEGPRRAKLNMICMRHKIRIRPVEKEEFGLTLGALCGKMPVEGAAEVTPFDEEMIVMADLRSCAPRVALRLRVWLRHGGTL